jgi:hypothetical protein
MGIGNDLRLAVRRYFASRGAPRPSLSCEAERAELRRWFERAQAASPATDARLVEIESASLPWTDSGLDLRRDEWVSTFAAGRVVLSDPLDLWVGPGFQLWMRVGEEGPVFRGTRESHSFRVEKDGRLYLAGYFPGQWGDPSGRVSTSLLDYRKFTGGLSVAVLRWPGEAAVALDAAASAEEDGGRFSAERERLRLPDPTPKGWRPLWMIGPTEIFRDTREDGRACIACRTHEDVAILQHDAPFDLAPGTRIAWDWRVDELPSPWREDSALTHDYLSVAVEFENGRDLTYTWSPELPAGTGYWCPLPTWKDREFHVVVRSGAQGLGQWLSEERDLHADYLRYIGEPPRRVVRVWLIAVSIFQRKTGRALFADLRLEGRDGARLAVG